MRARIRKSPCGIIFGFMRYTLSQYKEEKRSMTTRELEIKCIEDKYAIEDNFVKKTKFRPKNQEKDMTVKQHLVRQRPPMKEWEWSKRNMDDSETYDSRTHHEHNNGEYFGEYGEDDE